MRCVRARDHAGRVLALPNQTPGLLAITGLSHSQVNASVWVMTWDGRTFSGAAACNRILLELGAPWSALARLYALPGLAPIEEYCYAWFARNRGQFVRWGIRPACARPGVPCTPEGE